VARPAAPLPFHYTEKKAVQEVISSEVMN